MLDTDLVIVISYFCYGPTNRNSIGKTDVLQHFTYSNMPVRCRPSDGKLSRTLTEQFEQVQIY